MKGTSTRGIATEVVESQTFGDWAYQQFINDAVYEALPTPSLYAPISACNTHALPFPATTFCSDQIVPETIWEKCK